MKRKKYFTPLLLCVLVVLCIIVARKDGEDTQLQVENIPILTEAADAVTIEKDIVYQETDQGNCRLDIAYSSESSTNPLLVCVHGGSWVAGAKEDMTRYLYTFSNQGYTVACLDYDLVPEATMVEQITLLESAVQYLVSYADKYHINKEQIILLGESAGAHLALALGERIANQSENYDFKIAALVDLYGPTDLEYMIYHCYDMELFDVLIKNPQVVDGRETSDIMTEIVKVDIIKNLPENMPPVLIIHGSDDTVVPLKVSENFCEVLQEKSIDCKFEIVPYMKHEQKLEEIVPRVNAFLKEYVVEN